MLRPIVGYLVRSVLRPARREVPVRPLRSLVGVPIVFDLVSWTLQVIDIGRLRAATTSYAVDDAHHRSVQDYNFGVTQSKMISTTRRTERL